MVIRSPQVVRPIEEAIIIGCGSMGKRHTENLRKQGVSIKAFADPTLRLPMPPQMAVRRVLEKRRLDDFYLP